MVVHHKTTGVRHHEIIEAARKIIANHGMERLTIKELADTVGLTEGAIYRHFSNKRDVLLGLIEDIEESLFEAIKEAVDAEESPIKQLKGILREHLSYAERRRGVSFLVISEVLNNGNRSLKQRMSGVIERYLGTIEGILENAKRQGQISNGVDSSSAAVAMFGLVQGSVTLWHVAGSHLPPSERFQPLWRLFLDGLKTA